MDILANRALLIDIGYTADAYDAISGDGFATWGAQMQCVQERVDELIGVFHEGEITI